MARVSLYLMNSRTGPAFLFIRPNGIRGTLDALRLRAFVDLSALVDRGKNASKAAFPECILDTGSHLSILPERIWASLRPNAITRLVFDSAMPLIDRMVSVAGGTYSYELGELRCRLIDRERRSMNVTIIAKLIQDGGRLTTPMVLGLRGGVLDGRILRSQPAPASPFGEAWTLEDP